MGGSDQWGNIVNGIDLGRRLHNAQLFALTSPLITTSSGAKMGKTAAGAVWLNADPSAPTNIGNIGATPKTPTWSASSSCSRSCRSTRWAACRAQGAEINEAKKILATEATGLVQAGGRRASGGNRAHDIRGGRPRREPADSQLECNIGGTRTKRAWRFCVGWACVVEWRGPTSNQEWRAQGKRHDGHR